MPNICIFTYPNEIDQALKIQNKINKLKVMSKRASENESRNAHSLIKKLETKQKEIINVTH